MREIERVARKLEIEFAGPQHPDHPRPIDARWLLFARYWIKEMRRARGKRLGFIDAKSEVLCGPLTIASTEEFRVHRDASHVDAARVAELRVVLLPPKKRGRR